MVAGAVVASQPGYAAPEAALTAGPGGIFYVTTQGGGANDQDTVFPFVVPGPLPVMGVGVAFGWSRKLRARIRLSQRNVSAKA